MSEERRIAQKSPFVMELQPGKYAWCACGRSSKQPFCDGAHSGTGLAPTIFEVDETKTVALCGCKHNGGDDPFCNGAHSKL